VLDARLPAKALVEEALSDVLPLLQAKVP
jgi:hypothetical protein